MTQVCSGVCPQENEGLETYASDRVADEEWVCRGAYSPRHGKVGAIRRSYIHRGSLRQGELSAWRIEDLAATADLASYLKEKHPQDGQILIALFANRAADLRQMQLDGVRALSVINDTRCDHNDGHDPRHVAIAPCSRLTNPTIEDDILEELVVRLDKEFRKHQAWAA